jgi:hypothetical protein
MDWGKLIEDHYAEHGISSEEQEAKKHRWVPLCVCGHTSEYHSGEGQHMDCRGAMPNRGDRDRVKYDPKLGLVYPPTCPCRQMRAAAEVDRPGRYFRQKVWTRDDVHPMVRGMKAMRTRIGSLKTTKDPDPDPDAAFAQRIRRLEGWRCAICGDETDAIAMYVSSNRQSQMRCPRHQHGATHFGPNQDRMAYESWIGNR